MIGGVPHQGGATWAVLQYLLGLRRLGHHVYFIESVPAEQITPPGSTLRLSQNSSYAAAVLREYGFADRWAFVLTGTTQTVGMSYHRLREVACQADLLINLSGTLRDAHLLDLIPLRLYLDLDPGFTQVWHDVDGLDMGFDHHTHFATVGAALGNPDCPAPTCGRRWITTVPPVVLEQWPHQPGAGEAITTVANWRSYGPVCYRGDIWGQKAHSWRCLLNLPARSRARFEVALNIDPGDEDDRRALDAHGWCLHDPSAVAATPATYRSFISTSRAEISIAKAGYAKSRCGWLSDRTVCYLASGRPVIAQDTGFDLPATLGLMRFSTLEEAIAAVQRLEGEYDRHARAARALAEDVFDSDKVLGNLVDLVLT
jgi:hypothetical protein